ncbi:hypothetical protein FOZ62_020463, partial [Perkinsus olseni]
EQGLVRPVEEEDSSVYSDTSSESERVLSFDAEPVEVSSGESDGEPVDEVGNQLGSNPKKGPADAAEEGREGGKREDPRRAPPTHPAAAAADDDDDDDDDDTAAAAAAAAAASAAAAAAAAAAVAADDETAAPSRS